jgi:hypothetical protein
MGQRGGARPNSGRKPKDEENRIRDLMKPYSLDAVKCLANIIKNEDARDSDRISASKLVIEYTYGKKPKETVENINIDAGQLTPEEIKKISSNLNESY